MAGGVLLRPGEEAWQGALDNLSQRFAQFTPSVVAETLRQNGGHAGRTAQALRKLPPPVEGSAGQEVAVAEKKGKTAPAAEVVAAVEKRPKAAAAAPEVKAVEKKPKAPLKAKADPYNSKPAPKVAPKERSDPYCAKPAAEVAAVEKQPKAAPAPAVLQSSYSFAALQAPEEAAKADADAPPHPDSKLIFVAALQGDVQQLKQLIAARADLNDRYTGRPNRAHKDKIIDATPLHLVVTMGKADIAEVLLKYGADFEAKMRRAIGPGKPPEEQYAEMTALHLAAMEGHANIVEMLIVHGADKSARMQLTACRGDLAQEREITQRSITPLEIAKDMASKGHSRESVISLLTDWS